ncbi:MAG: hypothetical protein LAN36_15450 [Acidobacteriia bacterium]|nr:hypothetical protein [Terriglobia bacterium]
MTEDAEVRLFEVVKNQDVIMHNLSAEMSVKTSLYLVFSAFSFSASIQVINFAKDIAMPCAKTAIVSCGISAAMSLLGGVFLLIAAMIRRYNTFPSHKMAEWIVSLRQFRETYPKQATSRDPATEVLNALVKTAEHNKTENEAKADWIERGAYCLFASVPFLAVGGALALLAFFSRPF